MHNRHLALAAGVVLSLIGFAVVVTTVRPSPALALMVRFSNVTPFGDSARVTLEITNPTTRGYALLRVGSERLDQGIWKDWENISWDATGELDPHGSTRVSCLVNNLPTGTRFRVVTRTGIPRQGLDSFSVRAQLWLSGKNRKYSLNPFDGNTLLFTDLTEMVVEFVAP